MNSCLGSHHTNIPKSHSDGGTCQRLFYAHNLVLGFWQEGAVYSWRFTYSLSKRPGDTGWNLCDPITNCQEKDSLAKLRLGALTWCDCLWHRRTGVRWHCYKAAGSSRLWPCGWWVRTTLGKGSLGQWPMRVLSNLSFLKSHLAFAWYPERSWVGIKGRSSKKHRIQMRKNKQKNKPKEFPSWCSGKESD